MYNYNWNLAFYYEYYVYINTKSKYLIVIWISINDRLINVDCVVWRLKRYMLPERIQYEWNICGSFFDVSHFILIFNGKAYISAVT